MTPRCTGSFCSHHHLRIGPGVDVNAWFVRATGRYYYTPNIRFEGTFLYADGEMDPFSSGKNAKQTFTTWLWEAKVEWKMDHSPFAFFFKYRGSQTDYRSSYNSSSGFWERQHHGYGQPFPGWRPDVPG